MIQKLKDTIADFFSKEQLYFLGGVVLFVLLAILFMGKVADIRIKELEFSLKDMNPERSASASLSLITRYQMLQKRLSGNTDTREDFLVESESLAIAAGGLLADSGKVEVSFTDRVSIEVVNAFSFLTGGKPVKDFSDDKGEEILRVAFLYERKRDYDKAISAYQTSVSYFRKDRKRLAYIFLHKGFCLALQNEKEKALKSLNIAYRLDSKGDNGRTAAALALFIGNLQKKLEYVESMQTSTNKGELFYRLMSYDKAINTLTEVNKTGSDQKALFYRGRSFEEIGNTKSAIEDYRKVIAMDRNSEWGIKANRRLYLLGAFYNSDKKLAEESKQNARVVNDDSLFEETRVFQETTQVEKIASIEEDEQVRETIESIEEYKEERKGKPEVEPVILKEEVAQVQKPSEVAFLQPDIDMSKIEADIESIRRENEQKLAIEIIRKPETLRQKRKTLLSEKFDTIDRIKLEDGNTYYGVIDEEGRGQVTLLTVLGKLVIPGDMIIRKDRVAPKSSFLDSPVKQVNQITLSANLPLAERRKLLSPSASREDRRKILRSRFEKLDKFILKDGNQFYGVIYSRTDSQIKLITVLGMMQIPADRVLSREKVESEAALR